ncbi:hypothetical protein GCM10027598_79310 [Amycolatopsis oliviviridis]|uniref:Uncharacterized protein n=1 Tax=Amycolatopsis oliviviridis TaxID=1471590 RepID=A0ABQ3LBB6_9PSEU|nr:hypothetical protein GCM10017790_09240 [Amycolatopsis oliviviridis]
MVKKFILGISGFLVTGSVFVTIRQDIDASFVTEHGFDGNRHGKPLSSGRDVGRRRPPEDPRSSWPASTTVTGCVRRGHPAGFASGLEVCLHTQGAEQGVARAGSQAG